MNPHFIITGCHDRVTGKPKNSHTYGIKKFPGHNEISQALGSSLDFRGVGIMDIMDIMDIMGLRTVFYKSEGTFL